MANLTITKVSDGYFGFTDDADNVYGGNKIEYWYDAVNIYFKINAQVYTYIFEEVSYDDGNETIGFASTIELISTLKSAGFTGNFNSGGATPQVKTYKGLVSYSGTGVQSIDLVNSIGIIWSKPDIDGVYYGTFPYEIVDKSKIFCLGFSSLKEGSQITDGADILSIKLDVIEDINGIWIKTLRNGIPANDVLTATLWGNAILIEDYN